MDISRIVEGLGSGVKVERFKNKDSKLYKHVMVMRDVERAIAYSESEKGKGEFYVHVILEGPVEMQDEACKYIREHYRKGDSEYQQMEIFLKDKKKDNTKAKK